MAEPFAPVVDGFHVSDQPFELLKKSKFTKPTIIEYSQNEGEKFIMQVFGSDPKRNETGPVGENRIDPTYNLWTKLYTDVDCASNKYRIVYLRTVR